MSATPDQTTDVVDAILGEDPRGKIAALRGQKPNLATELQDYYRALFEPEAVSAAAFSVEDRYLTAVRVASHTRSTAVADWYAKLAAAAGVPAGTISRVRDVSKPWDDASELGAAIRRADLVTIAPDATEATHIQELKDAGISPAGILSLSQVIAFVSYQVRLIAGLRAFGESA